MNILLTRNEDVRVGASGDVFIDMKHIDFGGLAINLYEMNGYIEIRKKDRHLRVYQFPIKEDKENYDFGDYWGNAEIVFVHDPHIQYL